MNTRIKCGVEENFGNLSKPRKRVENALESRAMTINSALHIFEGCD